MIIKVKDININYIRYGNKDKQTIVFLHGWGQNIDMMNPLGEFRKEYNDVIILDLPGHGKSEEPKYAWELSDFVEFLKEFLEKLNIENPILVGHSFGGRISLYYASKYKVKKMILFGSPFKKEIKKDSLKTKLLKKAKKVPILKNFEEIAKKHIGSTDYRLASPMMRNILVNTVNFDLTEDVKKIKCPTLLVWGTLDEQVPLSRAYELESLIKDAGVVEYEGCTHYAYLERLNQTKNIMNSFLGKED
jgi:pimeloyl-ACP methyl ester carboxylesterase